MALRRYKRKKRPDRTPFNPLPETYDDDEEADLPHEVLMDRAEYEELTEEEQQRVRTHQGLLRLRRNEQKLVRLLQMQKPDRVDLLMLLNEVEQLQGMERKMHERYIGPKVGLEQLQDDLDLAFGWKGLEEDDFPEIVGDSQAVELTRERRSEEESESEEKMEEDEAEEEEQKKLAGGTSSALITTEAVWQAEYKLRTKQIAQNKRRALESGEPSDAIEQENPTRVRLLEAHERWKQVEEKKRRQSEPELSEPLLADEEETQRLEELKEKFPDGYDENHQDDEFFEAEAAQDLEAEVDLMTSDTDVGTRETELTSEEKAEADRLVEEGRKDPSVQALLGGADEMQRVLSKGKLSEEDVRRLQELEQKEEQELAVLEEHSTLWRAKQEVVAQWRAAMASAGHKLDDAEVSAFLNAVSDEEEEQLREFDDVSQEAEMDKELVIKRAQQQVRKQKKWLSELREVFGEETVKQLVRDGRIQLKTHAALGQVLRENVQADLAESLAEVSELQKEMESFDAEVAQLFGISVEDVQKLSESPTAEVAIPSLEERQRLHAEQMPAQAQKQAEEFSALLSSLTQRDMLAEADAAEAEDDMVAARKLRLMHARRMEWEQSDEDDSSRASMSRQDLQRLGDVLAEGNREGDVDASSYAIQRTQFGRVSAEEVKLNRELIARGDGNDERFVDEDVHDPANRSSFVQAITLPPEQLRIRDESKVDDAIPGRKQRAARSATEHVEALVAANNAAALEYSQMSVEKKMEISNADEKAHREDNDDFDDYVLSQLPLKLHKKAVRMWKRLSEADRNAAILQGRENRDRLRAWMGERLLTYSEDEHQPDVLTQYYIDEKDPKIYNAIEGAFWTVGRWGLDERTDEQREADVNRRIVPRFRPHVADTQQLLDQVEAELFGVRADELTEKDIDDDADLTEEDKRVYKERLRLAKRQQPNTQLEAGDGEVEDAVMVDGVDGRDRLKAAGEEGVDVGEEGEAMVEAEKAGDELLAEEGRVEEDTLRASDADDDRERDQYDVFSEEEEDPDAEDERRKGRRNRDEDAAADDDGEGMDQEDEERMPPTEPGSESELQQRKRREMDARRIKFQDFDPIPTGDQRAFDDRYFHFDEEDWSMLQRLDPIGMSKFRYQPPVSEQTASNYYTNDEEKGQNVLSEDTRQALYLLHKSNPSVWTPSALAMKFRMSHAHMQGILFTEAAEQRAITHGTQDPTDEEDERMAPSERTMSEMKTFISMQKFRRHMVNRGHNGEMIPLYDREARNIDNVEPMLHYLPRLARPRVADVRFVSENDLQAVLEEERDVEERFLSHQQRQARREAEEYRRRGAVGTPTHPRFTRKADPDDDYQHPKVIDEGKLLPPVNYHLVLTDVTERSRDRFSLAVRDVTGYLRQPTPVEFMAVRRREKSDKSRFVNVEYRHEKNTPL